MQEVASLPRSSRQDYHRFFVAHNNVCVRPGLGGSGMFADEVMEVVELII